MSVDYEGWNEFQDETERRARKDHRCDGCRETIRRGDLYRYHVWKYDGDLGHAKHCLRCAAIFDHLRDVAPDGDQGPDIFLDCGHEYKEIHGEEPPPHIAALAFWRRGDPIPKPPEV